MARSSKELNTDTAPGAEELGALNARARVLAAMARARRQQAEVVEAVERAHAANTLQAAWQAALQRRALMQMEADSAAHEEKLQKWQTM